MELWSLMHFLMPDLFESHSDFKEWFSNPLNGMIESGGKSIDESLIKRLHAILRPFILRRLKINVEKQLPSKFEHIVVCSLSKRQRNLYEEFMSKTETKKDLESGNLFRVLTVIMQLRKVCNHPDLFEERPIVSPFSSNNIVLEIPSLITKNVLKDNDILSLKDKEDDDNKSKKETEELKDNDKLLEIQILEKYYEKCIKNPKLKLINTEKSSKFDINKKNNDLNLTSIINNNEKNKDSKKYEEKLKSKIIQDSNNEQELIKTTEKRSEDMKKDVENFTIYIPKAKAEEIEIKTKDSNKVKENENYKEDINNNFNGKTDLFRNSFVRQQVNFPDKKLLQYDCGKLQKLSLLLHKLKKEGHRVLIFTQMR
jgi:SNF2 family DNA or RNA helicase